MAIGPIPYYWLRDDERRDADVLAYLAAENDYHAVHLQPVKALEDAIYAEIVGRLKQDDSTVPYRKNGSWYYTRFELGQEHPIFARRRTSLEAPEEILLNANDLAIGHDYYQIGELDVSPNGEWLAFCEDTVGRRQYTLRFKNLRSGEILPDRIEDVEADLAWANDNCTLLYVEKDPETLLGLYVKKHRIGTDRSQDLLVFAQTDTHALYGRFQIKVRALHLHLDGEHGVVRVALRRCGRSCASAFKVFSAARTRITNTRSSISGDRFHHPHQLACPKNFRLMRARVGIGQERIARRLGRRWLPHRDDTFHPGFRCVRAVHRPSVRSQRRSCEKISIQPLGLEGDAAGAPQFFDRERGARLLHGPRQRTREIDTETCCATAYSSLDDAHHASTMSTCVPATKTVAEARPGARLASIPPNYRTEFVFGFRRATASRLPVSLVYRKRCGVRDGSRTAPAIWLTAPMASRWSRIFRRRA